MNFQYKKTYFCKWRLQVVITILFFLSTVPAFAILVCNSPEYRNVLCSQSAEILKVFTAHLSAVKKDSRECENPPRKFVGIECEGEFPTITCPEDAPAQKAFLDALAICNKAKEGGEETPEGFGDTPTGPGGIVAGDDSVLPTITQPPATGPTVSPSPSSPGNTVVDPPKTSSPSVITRPRDPNAYKKFIPELPGDGGTQDDDIFNGPTLDHGFIDPAQVGGDESKPMVSKELTDSFKAFPREQQPVEEEVSVVIEVVP